MFHSLRPITLCLKLAVKELLNHRKFSFFLMINLALGLLSFLIIDTLNVSINDYINNNSRKINTADITISSRRELTELEKKTIEGNLEIVEMTSVSSYFTMMESKEQTRLIRSQVIEDGYPFYGELRVRDFSGNIVPWEQVYQEMTEEPIVTVSPELLEVFGDESIVENERIKVGDQEYRVKYLIDKDVEQGVGFRNFSHKVFIAADQHFAKLKEKGNSVRYRFLLRQRQLEMDSQIIAKELDANLKALEQERTPPQVRAHNQGGGMLSRVFGFVHNYLGLISLVTLFLSGMGAFYLYRSFLYKKLQDIAIMENLGMKKWQTFLEAIFQLLILGFGSIFLTLLIFLSIKNGIPVLIGQFIPDDLDISLTFKSVTFIFIIALVAPLLFTLPLILATRNLQPIFLIKKSFQLEGSKVYFWGFVPSVISFYLLSIWISDSLFRGSIFSLVFLLSIAFIFLLGFLYWKVFDALKEKASFTLAMIIKNLSRNRSSSSFYFFAIATSVLLISLIPQIEFSIRKELAQPKGFVVPSLFLFNIQNYELDNLKEKIDNLDSELDFITPFISAELTHKNQIPVTNLIDRPEDDTGREGRRRSSRMRRINLTYRAELSPSETIVEGTQFAQVDGKKSQDELIEISMERNYAQEMGFKMGDQLSFRLIDVPFEFTGKIVNYRTVKWNSFQPNFFITIAPGLLEEIPHQYVASIAHLEGNQKTKIQNSLFKDFPNVSVIDVVFFVTQALNLIGKIGIILIVMAMFCFILGMFILFTIINHEVRQKEREINLFKALGGKFYKIYFMVIGEHLILGFLAIITGFFPSIILNYIFGLYFFQGAFSFSGLLMLQICTVIFLSVLVISYLGSRKALQSKPISLLSSQ